MNPELTAADQALLIKKTELPMELRQKLSSSSPVLLNFSESEISILAAATIKASTRFNDPKIRKELKIVLMKLLAAGEESNNSAAPEATIDISIVKKAILELEKETPGWSTLDLGEKIQAFNNKLSYPTIEKTTEALEVLIGHLNNSPLKQFGSLSPSQISTLINGDWTPDTPGIQLNVALTTSEVISTPIIARGLVILKALGEKGTKATPAGNLTRKFVASVMEQMEIPEDYLEYLFKYNKVINESDIPHVEITRIVLEFTGTIKLKKQKIQLTSMGRKLMTPGDEGGLFIMLFVTYFREFNLGFNDRIMDIPEFQDNIAYSLYRMSILNDGWHEVAETSEQLILPSLAERIPHQPYDFRSALVTRRLLVPLELFGLVELKREVTPGVPLEYSQVVAFRKTGLLGRLLRFILS